MSGAVYKNTPNRRKPPVKKGSLSKPEQEPKAVNVRRPVSRHAPEPPSAPEKEQAYSTILPPRAPRKESVSEEQRPARSSGWVIALTPSILVMLVMLLLVTLTFFFGFGLIIGRGSIPPVSPPQLESFIPAATVIYEPDAPEHILPQEELRFLTTLRHDGDSDVLLPLEGQEGDGSMVTQAMPEENQANVVARPPLDATTRYDFILQVAAFKVEEQADALRLRLEDAGLRTRLVRQPAESGTWYHVQVLHRGTEVTFQQLRGEEIPTFGLRDSMLISRTLVE